MDRPSDDHAETERRQTICDFPEELLLSILLLVPIKDAVSTSILSKRWRYVWTMLPDLTFKDEEGSKSVGCFIDQTLQLHKAPKLRTLIVELGRQCAVDEVDVGKCVEKAVNRGVEKLDLKLLLSIAEPTSLPMSLYSCDTLVSLTLSNKILVDISSSASLPSLLYLTLFKVVYKDQDSLASLLSSTPVLKHLKVERHEDDNLTIFTVKVSTLKTFYYMYALEEETYDNYMYMLTEGENRVRSVVLDCPALTNLRFIHVPDHCSIKEMPYLDEVQIDVDTETDEKFLRYISSARHMCLHLTKSMVAYCNAIIFSRLTELYLNTTYVVDWLVPITSLLQNSPKLKSLVY